VREMNLRRLKRADSFSRSARTKERSLKKTRLRYKIGGEGWGVRERNWGEKWASVKK